MIQNVQVIPLTTYQDDRGFLMEIIRVAGDGEPHAVAHKFGQVYLVGDPVRGAIRAYHKHAELWDWFCIVHGTAKFVLKDDRPDSSTYGEMMTIVTGQRASVSPAIPTTGKSRMRRAFRPTVLVMSGRLRGGSMSKKILVVGGAGYVGSVLTHELLERGYAVRILDRLYFGDLGLRDQRDRVELVVGDMRVLTNDVLEDVEAVINVGGLSNDPTAEYNPKANYEMNTLASKRLADLCVANGVRRYIFASSCSIYDRGVGDQARDVLLDEETEVDPRAAYSSSKREAEKLLLDMAGDNFCPVILRKGTIYGFSPRMRYDLVVNTFVKDALSKGRLTIHYGGEMWRPLVEVRDVARAYIACLRADEEDVKGQIFNVSFSNMRISELALRVRETFRSMERDIDILSDYSYRGVRSYRVSAAKIQRTLGFHPQITVEESVRHMVEQIQRYGYDDFSNPRYYNIRWMRMLEEAQRVIEITGAVFEAPATEEEAWASSVSDATG